MKAEVHKALNSQEAMRRNILERFASLFEEQIRVNHFTVLANELATFSSLPELNTFLQSNGFTLNEAGGVVKGNPLERLEQSSTVAKRIPWRFADGEEHPIMSCYYEFARRYAGADGKLFQGFVPASADKIFESTYEKK